MSTTTRSTRHFATLDMLRGVAALAVVGRHLNGVWQYALPGSHLAVDLFFALSGFVIAHAYAERLREGLKVQAFMRIRLIRLYPLYALGTAIGIGYAVLAAVIGADGAAGTIEWIGAVTLAFGFMPALFFNGFHIFPFNPPAWSLFWELGINAIYGLVAARLTRFRLAIALILSAVLLISSSWLFGGLQGGSNFSNWVQGPQRVPFSFLAGIAVHGLWVRGALSWLRLPSPITGALLILIFAIRPHGDAPVFDAATTVLVFPLLILAGTREPSPRWRGSFYRLGAASYAVYALHAPFVLAYEAVLFRSEPLHGIVLLGVETLFIIGIFILALAADRYFDTPVRRWLNQRWGVVRNSPIDGDRSASLQP